VDRLHKEADEKRKKQMFNEEQRIQKETEGCTFVPNRAKKIPAK
jgi:hypothetical protein